MRLLYGTHNPAKLASMRTMLSGLDLSIIGLDDLHIDLSVDESGADPQENSKIKALAYSETTHMPVFAADTGLTIEGLTPAEQPGVHIRRVHGKRLNDQEMVAHYAAIANANGGRVKAHYDHALCLIPAKGCNDQAFTCHVASQNFWIVGVPHEKQVDGFPIDGLSVDCTSGKYFYDLPPNYDDPAQQSATYRNFFTQNLYGLDESAYQRLRSFVASIAKDEPTGHDWYHAKRVMESALAIARNEGQTSLAVITLAGLLHDIDDGKVTGSGLFGQTTAAHSFLVGEKYPPPIINSVCEIIATLSYKGAAVPTPMSTLEGRAVQDADRLDAIGAIGIARAFAYGGAKGRLLHDPFEQPQSHATKEAYRASNGATLTHFYEKLLLLKDRMQTATGYAMAQERHLLMEDYVRHFLEEWEV